MSELLDVHIVDLERRTFAMRDLKRLQVPLLLAERGRDLASQV